MLDTENRKPYSNHCIWCCLKIEYPKNWWLIIMFPYCSHEKIFGNRPSDIISRWCFAHGIRHPLGFTCCARAWLYLTITPALKKIWPHFRTKTRRIAHPASRASQKGETLHESGRKKGVYCVYSTSSLIFSSHWKCYPLEICCITIEKDNLLWVFLLKTEIFHGLVSLPQGTWYMSGWFTAALLTW